MVIENEDKKRYEEYVSYYNFLQSIENLTVNFGPVADQNTQPLEQVYIYNIFRILTKDPVISRYQLFILTANSNCDYNFDENSIVFYLSNEDHEIPENVLRSKLVFSPYCPNELSKRPANCFPIPLGYNGSLSNLPLRDYDSRTTEVFYSGNLHRRRLPFYINANIHKALRSMGQFFTKNRTKERISFTRSFTGGLSPVDYSNTLMDTRIALVPEGYRSDISFRFFEALKYGCVVVTPKLYNYWFFEKFPGIQVGNWIELHGALKSLKKNPIKMQELHRLSLEYYEKYCSEEAVAGFILSTIKKAEKE